MYVAMGVAVTMVVAVNAIVKTTTFGVVWAHPSPAIES